MKTPTVVFVLLLCLPALAEEAKPWPQKGQNAYVSAEIKAPLASLPTFVVRDITISACSRMKIVQRPSDKSIWVHDDIHDAAVKICDGWRDVVHESKDACAEAAKQRAVEFGREGPCFNVIH